MGYSFDRAEHLPKLREKPADPDGLPRQRRGTTPQMHGRYPDYDVLANAGKWDEVTREVVLARVNDVPPVRFFSETEARTAAAFCDVVLAQDREPRIPVMPMVDAKLFEGELDGFRYDDMPEDPETWRRVLAALEALDFATVSDERRREIVQAFSEGKLDCGLNTSRAWSVVMRAVLSAFYSHPWAWNEIGFGGPAYPRGYMRLQPGRPGREPFEAVEAFGVDPVRDVPQRGLE
jgi:gluconate 2-dehydrogenase subunit 3-like protein